MIPTHLIVLIDAVTAMALVGCLVALWRRWRDLGNLARALLAGIIVIALVVAQGNVLEWSGLWPKADLVEDFVEPLIPILWLFLFAVELERADRERLARGYERLKAVHDLALKLTMMMEPQAVMEEVVDAAGRLLRAPFVVILAPDEARETLTARAGRGISAEEIQAWRFRLEEGIGGAAFLQRRPLRTDQPGRDLAPPARPIMARHGITSAVSIPLLLQAEAVGILNVGRTRGETFSDEDIHLLETLCAHAAVAIENARLYAKVGESEAKYRVLVENAQIAIVAIDRDRTIRFWNRGAEQLYGWTADEAMGRHIALIYPKDKLDEVQRTILAALERDGTWSGEFPLARKDGSPFTGYLSLAHIRDAQGRVLGTVGIQADVTERVQLRDQLFQAQKMETVGTLAAGIAHDFSNLLTAILGFASLLRDSLPPDSENRECAVSIEAAAQRGTQLVRQLMSFGHGPPVLRRPLDLNRIVQEIVELLKRTFPRITTVATHLASDLDTVEADASQMQQVLMNLAVNARDAMPNGGTLTIATENVPVAEYDALAPGLKAGRYVALTVTDTGQGIPPGVQPRIFEPFFTTKTGAGGTGLGLSTVYAIVKRHGGSVTFRSQVGQGTAFRILLPAVGPPAPI
jgi:PAS domain S-box-containing protein